MTNKKKYIITAHDEYEMADLEDGVAEYIGSVSLRDGQKCKVIIEILDDTELIDDDGDLDDLLDEDEDEDF